MITLDPSLTSAAQRQLDAINAARPKDSEGAFIDPPLFASVDDMLSANVTALVQSWKEVQDFDDAAKLRPIADALKAADPAVAADVLNYAKTQLGIE